jgi:uncharacterized protein DUF6463
MIKTSAPIPMPGRWLRLLSVSHATVGAVVYRKELRDIASRGFVGAAPYRSKRAAALWFIGSAMPGWLVGRLVDVAADAGDEEAVRMVGVLGLAAGVGAAVVMPTSMSWLQVIVCARLIQDSRLLARREIATIHRAG